MHTEFAIYHDLEYFSDKLRSLADEDELDRTSKGYSRDDAKIGTWSYQEVDEVKDKDTIARGPRVAAFLQKRRKITVAAQKVMSNRSA